MIVFIKPKTYYSVPGLFPNYLSVSLSIITITIILTCFKPLPKNTEISDIITNFWANSFPFNISLCYL